MAADVPILEGWTVIKRWTIVGLLAVSVSGITGCSAGQTTSSAVAVAAVTPSPSAAATSTPTAAATASPTATPEPTATPAPTPKPTPVPWVVYKSKLFKYSIKHPPDWIVTPGSSSRTDMIDDFNAHYVYLERDTVSTWVDIKGTVDQEKAYYKSHYKAKLISDKKVSVGVAERPAPDVQRQRRRPEVPYPAPDHRARQSRLFRDDVQRPGQREGGREALPADVQLLQADLLTAHARMAEAAPLSRARSAGPG